MQKTTVCLFVTGIIIIAGLQLLVPFRSNAEQEQSQTAYYTIQIGTYVSEDAAERIYQRLSKKLNDSQLQDLRIEKIKNYYVVRIGRYNTRDDSDRFYPEVKAKVADAPLITKTRIGPENLVKQYSSETSREPAAAAALQPQRVVPLRSAPKEEARQKDTASMPTLAEKKKKVVVPALTEEKEQLMAAQAPGKEKKKAASTVEPETVEEQKQCVAKPVLVLTDVSGSMLGLAMRDGTQPADDAVTDFPITKVELLKQLLQGISQQLAVSQCGFGVYRFRFFPGKHLLYEPLLKIDSHEPGYVRNILQNNFPTDYNVYNRSSPISEVLQQLDIDILWKLSGRLTILLISDGILTNNEFHSISDSQIQTSKNKMTLLLAEVRWLKKKYGNQITIHSIYIASGDDKSHAGNEARQLLLQDIAEIGGGSAFSGMKLLQNDRLMHELSADLCCAGK